MTKIFDGIKMTYPGNPIPHEPTLCHCGTVNDAAEAALRSVFQIKDHQCLKWMMMVSAFQFHFAQTLYAYTPGVPIEMLYAKEMPSTEELTKLDTDQLAALAQVMIDLREAKEIDTASIEFLSLTNKDGKPAIEMLVRAIAEYVAAKAN